MIQLAGRTHVVSLPSRWVKKYGVKKGDELELTEYQERLTISTCSALAAKRAQIDISDLNSSLIWRYLNSAYTQGIDEIELHFTNQTTINPRTGKTSKTLAEISKITDGMIGIEMIRHGKNSCTLKEISKAKQDEFENVLRRVFLILSLEAKDLLNSIKTKDRTIADSMKYSEANINKLCNYCLRFLNRKIYKNHVQTIAHNRVITLLEEIGDLYFQMAEEFARNPKIKIKLIEKTNNLLSLFYKAFYDLTKENIIKAHDLKNQIKNDTKKAEQPDKISNLAIRVSDKIMDAMDARISIDIQCADIIGIK